MTSEQEAAITECEKQRAAIRHDSRPICWLFTRLFGLAVSCHRECPHYESLAEIRRLKGDDDDR